MGRNYFDRPAVEDLSLLLEAYASGRVPCFAAPLTGVFAAARAKLPGWMVPGPILAVSFGGSNSAAGVVEFRDGRFHVQAARRIPNPPTPIDSHVFFDDLFLADPVIAEALRAGVPSIGAAIAVPVVDGIPCHPSKIATVRGLVCPSLTSPDPACHFPTHFQGWLGSRGLPLATVRCEGDAPLAHLGGVACAHTEPDERSLLLVVGTGLGMANEREFILPSMLKVLCQLDPGLFPPEDFEDGQFQYQIAGKGIYKTLRRAIMASGLEVPLDWLGSPVESKFVFLLGQNDSDRPELAHLRDRLGSDAYEKVRQLAARVVRRGVRALAAVAASTMARECAREEGPRHRLFFEGSIMLNTQVLAAFREELEGLLAHRTVFESHRFPVPSMPLLSIRADNPPAGSPAALSSTDLTLLGAATLGGCAFGRE